MAANPVTAPTVKEYVPFFSENVIVDVAADSVEPANVMDQEVPDGSPVSEKVTTYCAALGLVELDPPSLNPGISPEKPSPMTTMMTTTTAMMATFKPLDIPFRGGGGVGGGTDGGGGFIGAGYEAADGLVGVANGTADWGERRGCT
ncbi:MAG: hypothetical protein WA691_04040 [Thermoplasmata archaeon]